MPIITDPSDLNQGTEVVINTTTKTIRLLVAGNMSVNGVTLQALYSFLANEWISDATLKPHIFPLYAITDSQFDFKHGWTPYDFTTRKLIRNSGWSELTGDVYDNMEMGVVSLGALDPTSQPYYQQELDGDIMNMVNLGKVNEPVHLYGDEGDGNGFSDHRAYFKIFVREQGFTYTQSSHTEIEVDLFDYKVYPFPLSNTIDTNISTSDAIISTSAPWNGITVTYHDTDQVRSINGVDYNFNIIIDGNGGTLHQIYEKIQYLLRQNSDIDSGTGTVIGKTADLLLRFIGDSLHTYTGIFIDNYPASESKNLIVYDNTGTARPFPIVSVLTVEGLITGSFIGIYDNEIVDTGNNNTLLEYTNSSLSTFAYTHNGTVNDVVIIIIKDGYIEQRINQTIGVDNQTITIVPKLDDND